jgi:bisphosphoglycerate-dependent phosphoglycerate mutase
MDDTDDPVVEEKDVPSFSIIEEKIKAIDNTIIIYRVYYFFNSRIFRFQLIKKNKMCMIELHRNLLESLGKDGTSAEQQLMRILDLNIENDDCWNYFEG